MSLIKERYHQCDICGQKIGDDETRYSFIETETDEYETLLGFRFLGEKAYTLDMCPKCMVAFRSFVRNQKEKDADK